MSESTIAGQPSQRMFKFFKNIFSIGVAQTSSSIGAFVVNILMANILPAYSYGTYKFLTSWVSLLTISSLPQVQYSYGNAVARGQRGGYKNIVIQKIKYGLIGSTLAVIMAIYYTVMKNSTLSISFFVIAVFIPFLDALTLYNGYFQGTREYIRNAKLLIIQSLITYLLIIGVFLYTQSIPILIGSYLLAWIIPRLPINFKLGKLNGSGNEAEVQEVVTYGKKLTLYDSILYVTQFADKLVLFYLLGAREVAVYAIAVAFPDQIKSYVKNIYFMLQARFATSSFARIFSNTKQITTLSIIGLVLITIIYMLGASFLLKIFFPTYTDAIYISIIYSISIVSAIYTIPSLAIRANNNEKELLKINAFRGLTYCALVVIGTMYFGIIGAVVGKVIGDYIYATSYYVMMYKISNRIPVNTNNN